MKAACFLRIVRDIHYGVRDADTTQPRLHPLWQYPLMQEALQRLLEDMTRGNDTRDSLDQFHIICDILCPTFYATVSRELDSAEVG